MSRNLALIGNPNCGKTTLFNILTGSNQYVGNWAGVTVEKKAGKLKNTDYNVVDLPGIYALSPYSIEEKVTQNFLLNENPDAAETSYIPGVYTSALPLSGYSVDMEVVVNESGISSVRLVNLDEAVTTMYPLMEPTLASVSTQLTGGQPLSSVTYQDENKYTTLILLETIQTCLDKAAVVSE